MKKFILEISIISALVIGTGFFLYTVGLNSVLVHKIKSINKPLNIINLGTSHGNNFDYHECEQYGIGINKEGNTLYYDLQNLIYLHENKKLSDSAIIIIPVSYFAFGLGENREDRLPDNSFVNDYYYYLPTKQIKNYSSAKKKSLIVFSIQKSIKFITGKESKSNRYIERSDSQLKKHAIARTKHHRKISGFRDPKKNITYLNKIIEYAKSKGYRPILVCTPYYHYYNEYMGEKWLTDNYFNVMDSLQKKHNIKFLDYSHDKKITYANTLFGNSDHLNAKGRALFSRMIFDEIFKNKVRTHNNIYAK